MKKVLFFLLACLLTWAFVIVVRMGGKPTPAQAMQPLPTYASPTLAPTYTPIPTPTIGYESTLAVAQATADEARRVNAEVTAVHEANILSILQVTAEAERRAQEILSWTAQAGPTIIPLTATMQAIANTQIAQGQSIQLAQFTATAQAPTQIAAMAQSYAAVQWAGVTKAADVVGKIVFVLFMLAGTAFFVRMPREPKPIPEAPKETIVQMRHNTGGGTYQQVKLVIPCSPEQLTELAELAVNGEKRFGINRIETSSHTFKGQRQTLIAVREFLVDSGLAIKADDGLITLNADGTEFLTGWFDAHKLPDEYEFGDPETPPSPTQHDHDTHTHDGKHGVFAEGEAETSQEGSAYTQEQEGVL